MNNRELVNALEDIIDTERELREQIEKLNVALRCNAIISSMGTGNKLDPTRLEISDISKTSVCPLARVMRYELRKRGINHLKVLYSKEEPLHVVVEGKRHAPGSISFVPSAAGLIIASEVVLDLIR